MPRRVTTYLTSVYLSCETLAAFCRFEEKNFQGLGFSFFGLHDRVWTKATVVLLAPSGNDE